ncbi:myotilin [Denticeps clupeoides]|uniref:Ig-like domain-containing protein n=1 Tax=Denticeps clupeoides TaxID=299321 RepID=A0AAY4DYU2_9TELE|nr:myotilin [Denticeps clupeoides]
MAQVQKKTSTVSLTISSCSRETLSSSSSSSSSTLVQQRHSSLIQPLCISSQRTESPSYSHQGGVAPTFVKCLYDVSTVKGQLVVLECRIRGTPPLQMLWYREEEQIVDSADFRILRKKASSASVPEELCTLVITEAYPEDSGTFKCVAGNQFGTVSCSCLLEVYAENILAEEEQEPGAPVQEELPALLQDAAGIPPPEWPDSPEDESAASPDLSSEVQPIKESAEVPSSTEEVCSHSLAGPNLQKATPTSSAQPFTPPRVTSSSDMSVTNLPTFSPSLYPPTAFNYERPRHFIQSQPHFQAPSYNSLHANGNAKPSPSLSTSSGLGTTSATPASSVSPSLSPSSPPTSPTRPPMRSSVTVYPQVSSRKPAEKPADRPSPAAFLCSVLPSQPAAPAASAEPPRGPGQSFSAPPAALPADCPTNAPSMMGGNPPPQKSCISLPVGYKPGTSNTLPKPILKKTVSRPVSRSTDEEIQGSKDALIQDLEKKLRCKEAHRRNSQKLSYEERMARRLLGPDNAASVFNLEDLPDLQPDQPDSPEGRPMGGIWSKHLSSSEGTEGSSIQEKCYGPRFLQVPQDMMVEEGRFCRVDFKVGGLPTPDVTWYLDGKAIRPDDYHKMLVSEKGVHSFIIEIVTVHHAGVYECVAKNRAGEARFSLRLDVIAQEMLRPPMFVMKMQNSRVLEGDMVRLECKVSASPPPQLYWKKDKEMLRIDPNRMSLTQDGSGRLCLLMDRVQKSDAGWYTVSAINEAGMSTCNARLDVGTRLNKAPAPARPLKLPPVINQFSTLGSESTPRHTAPLYESEEL